MTVALVRVNGSARGRGIIKDNPTKIAEEEMNRWVVLVLVCLLGVTLSAQTVTGTLRGNVSDRSGALLPGVTITIKNADTGLARVVVTESDGSYNAPFLPIGRYDVQAELSG